MVTVQTTSGKWEKFCQQILEFLKADIICLNVDGKPVRGFRSPDSPSLWIRDHSDILRASRYIESDVQSAVECFAGMQSANGRIFDFVMTLPLKDSSEQENWEKWVRVPVEADVEYRLVKAAYLAWQALGQKEWLSRLLPALERALNYTLTHPLRWDPQHQLVKRPYTIDTWDFDYTAGRAKWLNFQITDNTYWGIFHGDNSGMYEAARLLSKMYAAVGHRKDVDRWTKIASDIRKRANALLFNGRFYTHFYKLTPVTIHGVNETKQLSLSNPLAINRGLATHEIACAIIQEYQRRRESTNAFAEWFGIDPPFPDGIFGDKKLVAGAYINGGIFPLVGGELARAAFEHGFENYGYQTLERYRQMIVETNETYLWYFPDGTPSAKETSTSPEALPTDGWGASAMLYAFIEGLCGIEDLDHSFQIIHCAPRWIVIDEEKATVYVSYANSGASFGYQFLHLPKKSIIQINLEATNAQVELHLLLPQNCGANATIWNGVKVPFQMETIQNSPYVNSKGAVVGKAKVKIIYGKI